MAYTGNINILFSELRFTYARSSGAGGQNVNKVNSKAILRWPVATTKSLPKDVKARFLSKYANRITLEGDCVLSSQRYRDQNRNVFDCLEKLQAMIAVVAVPPTARRPTRPTKSSKIRRRETKTKLSVKKQQRSRVQLEG